MEPIINFPTEMYPVKGLSAEQQLVSAKYALMCLKMRRRKTITAKNLDSRKLGAAYLLKQMGWQIEPGVRVRTLADLTPDDITELVIAADKVLADLD